MENQLEIIADAYDKLIEFGRKGIDQYKDLPDYILNDPDYSEWKREGEKGNHRGSENKDIKDYLESVYKVKKNKNNSESVIK